MYCVDAAAPLLPWIAFPESDTRDGEFVVRATTLRPTDVRPPPRDTTLRDGVFARDAELDVVRATTLRCGAFARDAATGAVVVRTRDAALLRPDARDVAFARGDAAFDTVGEITGAIGSAKTARIDKNVEHTKNATASKKTVPIAFFATPAILRLVIHYSPADKSPEIRPLRYAKQRTDISSLYLLYHFWRAL